MQIIQQELGDYAVLLLPLESREPAAPMAFAPYPVRSAQAHTYMHTQGRASTQALARVMAVVHIPPPVPQVVVMVVHDSPIAVVHRSPPCLTRDRPARWSRRLIRPWLV